MSKPRNFTNWIFRNEIRPEVVLETREAALAYALKFYHWKYHDIESRILDPKLITKHGIELRPNEIWVTLEEAPRYAITNTGRCVLSMARKKWKEMMGTPAKSRKKPHLVVGLSITPGHHKNVYIHSLVEENFCRRFFDYETYQKLALKRAERNRAKKKAAGKYKNEKLSYRKPFDVHHLDGNVNNNSDENLVLLPRPIHRKLEYVEKYELLLSNGYIECQDLLHLTRVIGLEGDICSVAQPIADAYKTISKAPADVNTAVVTISYCPVKYTLDEETNVLSIVPMDVSLTDTPDKPHRKKTYPIRVTFRRNIEQ